VLGGTAVAPKTVQDALGAYLPKTPQGGRAEDPGENRANAGMLMVSAGVPAAGEDPPRSRRITR